MVAYKKENGDCYIPQRYPDNPRLATWASSQRTSYRQMRSPKTYRTGIMTQERIRRLEGLGFDWDPSETRWPKKYQELIDYRKKHGDCDVSRWSPEDSVLGSWVSIQRRRHQRGELPPDKIKAMEKLGFDWDPFETRWEEMHQELVRYKEEHGDCNVPYGWPENPKLASWVGTTQRQLYRNGVGLAPFP